MRRWTNWCRTTPGKPYDIKDVIQPIVDDGQFFEIHEILRP